MNPKVIQTVEEDEPIGEAESIGEGESIGEDDVELQELNSKEDLSNPALLVSPKRVCASGGASAPTFNFATLSANTTESKDNNIE